MGDAHAVIDGMTALGRIHPGALVELLLGNPGNLGHLSGRIALDHGLEVIEILGALLDELLVPEIFFQDDLHQTV